MQTGIIETVPAMERREVIAELQRLAAPTDFADRSIWPTIGALAFNWMFIVFSFVLLRATPWWFHAVLLCLIAARQHALLILMHDGAHFLLCRNKKWNDLLSDLFCAFPFGVSTAGYRSTHLKHHEHLNTEDDPDLQQKTGPHGHPQDWEFPKPSVRVASLFLRDLLGRGILYLLGGIRYLSKRKSSSVSTSPEQNQAKLLRLIHAVCLIALVLFSGQAGLILYAWLVPLLFILPAILRLRSVAEHFGLSRTTLLNSSRNVRGAWWEEFVFAPHNVCLHLDHHLFPYVPWYRLPALHKRLIATPLYRAEAHVTTGYLFGSEALIGELVSPEDRN
ncbi:MAG: fatty acid desaturase family protein [Bryobacteraceae bacterium]|nr:fatty acid desaturase family protein [Bryobacteraceae bacterium]